MQKAQIRLKTVHFPVVYRHPTQVASFALRVIESKSNSRLIKHDLFTFEVCSTISPSRPQATSPCRKSLESVPTPTVRRRYSLDPHSALWHTWSKFIVYLITQHRLILFFHRDAPSLGVDACLWCRSKARNVQLDSHFCGKTCLEGAESVAPALLQLDEHDSRFQSGETPYTLFFL